MELYQEVLYDLLSGKPREQCTLEIREDPQRGIHIPGLTEITVENVHDVYSCLMRGSSGRATASTNMNSQSSRSHAIFTLNICMQARNNAEENKTAKFHLVDLAGSERPKKTGAVGTTFKEGININKGLLVLGNVISALGEEKQQENRFVPYRDSNLTRLLKDSLGGNSITLMIACVSPADYNIDETLSTLRYADRARKIKNKPMVNQDPKMAQINELKKTVKLLQLQLIGQGGPTVSSEEVLSFKREICDLKLKVRDLTHKLSSALNDKAGILGKWLNLQSSNEILNNKITELNNIYNSAFDVMNFAVDSGCIDTIKRCREKFEDIKKKFEDLDLETKKAEKEIKMQEADITTFMENGNCNDTQVKEMNEIHDNFAARQIELSDELEDVMKKLAMKEMLAQEMAKNVQNMVDYENIRQNEWRIEALEKEKSDLLQQLKNVQQNAPIKLLEERRKRVKELEGQIQNLTKKLNEQNRLIRCKERDELKMRQLNQEILQMKQNRVRLVRSMKEEADRFKTWKSQREKELSKLKQADVKNKYQIQKMKVMHEKQQNVLKRKVEEAVAANKRLKDAMATRKAVQEFKFSGRLEKVTTWLKQELEIILGLTEIEVTLNVLLEDRALLQKQLDNLKSDSNPDVVQLKAIEDDIELRSVQIQDMQQKLLDSDEDLKNKINLDSLQTMAEAKQALKVLVEDIIEIKKKQCCLALKSIELESNPQEEQEKKYEQQLIEMEKKSNDFRNNLENEYQEKISILLAQLRGIEMKTTTAESENLKVILNMQQQKLEEQEKLLEEARAELDEEKREKAILKAQLKEETEKLKDETPPKRMKIVPPKFQNANKENLNLLSPNFPESPFVEDDQNKDPDWHLTPMGKKVVAERKNISGIQKLRESVKTKLPFEAGDAERVPSKRSSDGGCACTKDCSKRCGCRKMGKLCKGSCKCNVFACKNRLDSDEVTEDQNVSESFKKPRKTCIATRRIKRHPSFICNDVP
ncbi:hypothetical protein WA026_002257 [Henosepilachna vigintioctopunctata]|uniref:Kinesin-like protein n=1 Tax=Henosepilachna vigintioctopunctata TaxID=420089 RepID=A0AAW1U192_9CUCU